MIPLLEAHHVTKRFGGGPFREPKIVALEDFSMTIESDRPSITAIVGESGSGKTTMARLLLGLEHPTGGEVRYRGKSLRRLARAERVAFRREVQAIFQDPFEVFNPFYRVDHVLQVPIEKFRLARSKEEGRSLIAETLRAVGLRPEETLGRYPHQLSGGQRQRIMVARALLIRPKVIIADEPVSMIDASLRATVLANLHQLKEQFGISLVYITHDLTTAYQISDNIIVLYKGAIAEAGDVERVVKAPQHPYTQLLIGSIPLPDPDRRWSGEEAADGNRAVDGGRGCKFAPRCPHASEICLEQVPPLFQSEPNRATACFLWQTHQPIRSEALGALLVGEAVTPEL